MTRKTFDFVVNVEVYASSKEEAEEIMDKIENENEFPDGSIIDGDVQFARRYENLPKTEKEILWYMWKDNPDVEGEMDDNDRISLDWYYNMFDWVAEHAEEYEEIKKTNKAKGEHD